MLASPSDYDLVNAIENYVVRSTLFVRRDVRIAALIHGCDVTGMKVDYFDKMGISEKQPEWIQFTNRGVRVSINDLDFNLDNNNNDDNSINA